MVLDIREITPLQNEKGIPNLKVRVLLHVVTITHNYWLYQFEMIEKPVAL